MSILRATLAGLTVLATVGAADAQYYGRPTPPSPTTLDRYNLAQMWAVRLPGAAGPGDALARVQYLGSQVFAQTRSNVLYAIDARDGRVVWSKKLELPFSPVLPVAVNAGQVFAVNANRLYVLSRRTGRVLFLEQLSTVPTAGPVVEGAVAYLTLGDNKLKRYEVPIPGAKKDSDKDKTPSIVAPQKRLPSTPAEEEKRAAVDLTPQSATRLYNGPYGPSPSIFSLDSVTPPYKLPDGSKSPSIYIPRTVRPPYRMPRNNRTPSILSLPPSVARALELNRVRPKRAEAIKTLWESFTPARVGSRPILFEASVLAGTRLQAYKVEKDTGRRKGAFTPDDPVSAPLARSPVGSEAVCYVGTNGGQLLAVNTNNMRQKWRFAGTGAITFKPFVTDGEVFVGGISTALQAVKPSDGSLAWVARNVNHVRSVNPKIIYGADSRGRIHMYDRVGHNELAVWDVRDFRVPVVNEIDDRLVLAADDGLIVCVRDKEYGTPVPVTKPPAPPKKEEPREEEPKGPNPELGGLGGLGGL